jgi:hypothetical protein
MKRISKEIQEALVSLIENGKTGAAIDLARQLELDYTFVRLLLEISLAPASEVLMKMNSAIMQSKMLVDFKDEPTDLTKEQAAKAAGLKGNTYDDAYSKITMKMIASLGYGEEVKLNEKYYLYHYCEDDYIGLRHVDFEYEDIYTVQYAILEDDGKGNCTYDIVMSVEDEEIAEFLEKTEAAL